MAARKLRNLPENILMGARLRHLRKERTMSLRDFAEKVGVAYQQVQKYETGKNSMSVPAMKKIAAALEVNPCEICGCCDDR